MKQPLYLVTVFVLIALILGGCTSASSGGEAPAQEENPFADENNPFNTMDSIGHGLSDPALDENNARLPLQYDGGELRIDYSVTASGKAKTVGFLVFMDGIPQPYKIDSTESPYEYMHIFEIKENNKELPFTFLFAPVTGKAGETLEVTFLSVYNAGFQPDMVETTSFGGYHQVLPYSSKVVFNRDAEYAAFPGVNPAIAQETVTYEPVTGTLMLEAGGAAFDMTQELFDSMVFSLIYYNGEVKKEHNLRVDRWDTLNVTYKLCGAAGVRYRTTLYANHQPIASSLNIVRDTDIQKGKVTVLDAELDISKLADFSTFYAVSVPLNASDYPDIDYIAVQKTQSMLIYKTADPETLPAVAVPEPPAMPEPEPSSVSSRPDSTPAIAGRPSAAITETPPAAAQTPAVSNENERPIAAAQDPVHTDEPSGGAAIPGGISFDKIKGEIGNVFYGADANTVIVAADKLYLYDLAKGEILSETARERCDGEVYRPLKNGYVMTGLTMKRSNGSGLSASSQFGIEVKTVFYDSGLRQLAIIDISGLTESDEMILSEGSVAVSDDGNLIAIATDKGLYVYHVQTSEKATVVNCRTTDTGTRKGIVSIEQVAFTNDGKTLVFSAQSFDVPVIEGKRSFDTIGSVNIDGSGLTNAKVADNRKLALYGFTVEESKGAVFGSADGGYYAVTELGGGKLYVRVYDASSGKLVHEKTIKEDSRHMERDPVVRILDKSKTLIVLLGNRQDDIDTIVLSEQF